MYGSLNPDGEGYVYRLKSDCFEKLDDWQWISSKECDIIEKMKIHVSDYLGSVEFSDEAKRMNDMLYGDGKISA